MFDQKKKEVIEAVEIIQTCGTVYTQLKSDGTLDAVCNEIGDMYGRIRRHMAIVDIEVLKMYQDAGLSMEQAVSLILANKTNSQEFFKATSSKATKKK